MKQFKHIQSLEEFYEATKAPAALFYFSHEQCNVCKTLKPKVLELVSENFPEMEVYYVDTILHPDIAAQNRVFTNPVILIYFDGRELHRKARYIGMQELYDIIAKPYSLMFDEEPVR